MGEFFPHFSPFPNGQVYEQTNGVAMVFPLSPAVVDFFMEACEYSDLESAPLQLLFYHKIHR